MAAHHSIREALATLPAPGRTELVPAPQIVDEMRAVKEPDELALLQRSVDIADEVLGAVTPRIEPGWTEELVSLEIERESRKRGASGLAFPTIVASWRVVGHATRPATAGVDPSGRADRY